MDKLAERAGVGKGTVFRRFGSRAGLMMTLLSDAEAEFQGRFMFGPPPLGPGAPPLERLIAFGAERIGYVLEFGELARAADASPYNRFEVPAAVLWHRHMEICCAPPASTRTRGLWRCPSARPWIRSGCSMRSGCTGFPRSASRSPGGSLSRVWWGLRSSVAP